MEEYNALINILKEELVPAMGCTEPIALAYCASLCAKVLDEEVIQVKACVSGNIIKNVKSVIVPNTGGLKGIEASIAAGICAGDSDLVLEVISKVDEQGRTRMREFLKRDCIEVTPFKTREALDIKIECIGEHHCSTVRISQSHTHVVLIERDGSILFEDHTKEKKKKSDHSILSVEKIVEFANEVKIEDVKEVLERQIRYNMRIAEEGLKNSYGANVGKLLLDIYGDDVKIKARAYAAAGSDARMSGCEMPVIINSGSGNQGMTASLPVIIYAKEMKASEELLYRSLVVSNLITIHLKSGIAYLNGGNYELIAHTLVNAIAIASGIVCDGAKPSCASKIAVAVDAGIIGYYMAIKGQEFKDGEGLVIKGVENTIRNISRLSSKGMKKTDQEIIDMMCKC